MRDELELMASGALCTVGAALFVGLIGYACGMFTDHRSTVVTEEGVEYRVSSQDWCAVDTVSGICVPLLPGVVIKTWGGRPGAEVTPAPPERHGDVTPLQLGPVTGTVSSTGSNGIPVGNVQSPEFHRGDVVAPQWDTPPVSSPAPPSGDPQGIRWGVGEHHERIGRVLSGCSEYAIGDDALYVDWACVDHDGYDPNPELTRLLHALQHLPVKPMSEIKR